MSVLSMPDVVLLVYQCSAEDIELLCSVCVPNGHSVHVSTVETRQFD